jgi:hypothetical protein
VRRRSKAFAALLASLSISLALLAETAASYQQTRISEVHADGDGLGPDHNFIELQFYADGQNLVGGHWVATYDNSGAILNKYMIPGNVPLGESQRTVLIVENGSDSGSDFQPGALQVPTGVAGGGACYTDGDPAALPVTGIDCMAFGAVPSLFGNPSPFGARALLSTGLAPGQSLLRSIAPGCPTLLEAGDDTDNSAADFALGPPSPRVNSTAPTERPCLAPTAIPFNLKAAIKKCKKKFPKGPKRKKCIKKAKQKAALS